VTEPALRDRKKQRTREAIARAALELFADRGFSAVSMAQVAEAADVGQRTLFRYYADKEELLFGDDAPVQDRLRQALAARPDGEPPMVAAREALVDLAPLWQDARDHGRTRRAVIEASPALRARQLAKHAAYEEVLAEGLADRGTDRPQARLLARVAVACATEAISRWLDAEDPRGPALEPTVRQAFAELGLQLSSADDGRPA
jgi:AcrR family transcriptional regulator